MEKDNLEESFSKKAQTYLNWKKDWGNKEDFYFKELYSDVLKKFLHKPESKAIASKGYKYIISVVGFSAQPILFWHNLIKPVKHYFICSPETEKTLDRVNEMLQLRSSEWDKRIAKSTNILDIYQKMKEILDLIGNENFNHVVIDVTGGKKSMVAAAATIGELLRIDIGYIDYSEYLPVQRKPKPGSEYPLILDNPLKVFGDVDINQAKKFFNSYHFERAIEILDRIEKDVRNPREVQKLRLIAEIYKLWNDFEIGKSIEEINTLLNNVDERRIYDLDNEQRKIINAHKDLLGKIKQGLSGMETDTLNESVLYVPLNFYFAAERYAETSKFDIAVFLMYRTIESIGQIVLKKYGISPSNASEEQYKKSGLSYEKLSEIARNTFNLPKNKIHIQAFLPNKIPLFNGYMILYALKDPVMKGIDIKEILNVTKLRNNSVYAHGFKPLSESEYNEIRKIGRKLLNNFLSVNKDKGTNFTDFAKDFSFIKL